MNDAMNDSVVRGLRALYATHPMVMEAADQLDQLRGTLSRTLEFLTSPQWGTIDYMNGSQVGDDIDLIVADIRETLGISVAGG